MTGILIATYALGVVLFTIGLGVCKKRELDFFDEVVPRVLLILMWPILAALVVAFVLGFLALCLLALPFELLIMLGETIGLWWRRNRKENNDDND